MSLIQVAVILIYLALVIGSIIWVIYDNKFKRVKITATYSVESAEQLRKEHGLDMEKEITKLLSKALQEELRK
jgi:archaellum component FlaF (FlaF/FlaG flagellin family)